MKQILILADGLNAERFLERIGKKRIGENHYTVVSPQSLPEAIGKQANIDLHLFDPTSHVKLARLMHALRIDSVFILMQHDDEARACWDNVRAVDGQVEIVLLDMWGAFSVMDDSATHVLDAPQLIANRLYDHLPNVPVVAQNVGLAQGEIMEVLVPYGSSFAYRHIGSIAQVKWRIVAVYRDGKQILPTGATMIRPQDTLLILGKPQVLENIYHRIRKDEGRFPEPFGRHLYLVLDLNRENDEALMRMSEAIHLLERLEEARLYVRLINPGDFKLIEALRTYESERLELLVRYGDHKPLSTIMDDLTGKDIGLILMGPELFGHDGMPEEMLGQKKLVLLFGDTPLYGAERLSVLMGDEAEMEAISSTLFYAAETLELKPCLCYFDPEGNFETGKRVEEHYNTLAQIFQTTIQIEEKSVNPLRQIEKMDHLLHVVPFTSAVYRDDLFKIFSTHISDYLLDSTRHPKLLIPAEEA